LLGASQQGQYFARIYSITHGDFKRLNVSPGESQLSL
jgi:hypothetical protein